MKNEQDLRDFISRQKWIFAKTYVNRAPHEYVVRKNINGTDEEFMDIVDYIQNNGITISIIQGGIKICVVRTADMMCRKEKSFVRIVEHQ
ncbi:MAG: hypothetical protein K5870_06805 [Lachnospiraceae bacterium]|nr:hypothetical protein [Lachnospiraceae bacterium]